VACNIPLKKYQNKGYNFASKFISIGGLHTKLWAPKVAGIPILGISRPPFGVLRQNDIWVLALWLGTECIIRGKVVVSPSPSCGESYESVFACGLSVHQNAPTMH